MTWAFLPEMLVDIAIQHAPLRRRSRPLMRLISFK